MKEKKLGILFLSMLCVAIVNDSGGEIDYDFSIYPGDGGQSSSGTSTGTSISAAVPAMLITGFTVNSPDTPLSLKLSTDSVQKNWLQWLSYIKDRYANIIDAKSSFFTSNASELMVTKPNAYPYSMPGTSSVRPINGTTSYTAPFYYVKSNPYDRESDGKTWCSKNYPSMNQQECLAGYLNNERINVLIGSGFYDNAKYDRALLTEILMARLEGATSGLYSDSPARAGVLSGNAPYSVKFSKLSNSGMQDWKGYIYDRLISYSITEVFNQVKIMSNIVRNNLSTIKRAGSTDGGVATLSPLHTFAGFIVINKSAKQHSIYLKDGSPSRGSNTPMSVAGGSIGVLPTIDPANQIPSYQYTVDKMDGEPSGQRSIALGISDIPIDDKNNPIIAPFTINCEYSSNNKNEFPPYDATNSSTCVIEGFNVSINNDQLGLFFKTPQQWMAVVIITIIPGIKVSFNLKALIKVNTLDSPLTFVATTPEATSGKSFTFNERQLIQAPYFIYQDIYGAANTNDFARGLYNGYLETSGMADTTGNDMVIKNALTASYNALKNMYFSPNAYFSNPTNASITSSKFIDMLDKPEMYFGQTPYYQVVYNVPVAPAAESTN